MEKIDPVDVVELLRPNNPRVELGDLKMYADAFCEYQFAAANIAEHGTIVAHPRTGAPIENPYCKIRAGAMKRMELTRVRNANAVWEKWGMS